MEIEIKLPWPDWQVTKLLGAGGYGRVYEIHRDRYGISEVAAVKVLSFPNDEDEISEGLRSGYVEETLAAEYRQQVESVLKEYRLLKELGDDPHIVRCDDYAAVPHSNGIGWNVYLKMELLTPLKQYLGKSAIPPEQTVQLGSDICQALAACWAKRILHRDIKPDNILVSGKGVFKLSDFGEAKLVEKTMASGVAGTWSFVAPEVGNHSRYGEPADIYSLGMVLYWMLNRCMLPFLPRPWGLCSTAEQDQARQRRLSGEPLPPPADGSPALKKVVLKACAFRPEERYATPDELREALWAALRGEAPAGDPPSRSAERSMPTMPDGDGVSGNWAADSRWSGEPSSMKDEGSEGTMGCSWAAPSFEWGESSMPADSDLEETMPADGGPVRQEEAQPVKGNDLYREVSITPEQAEAGCQVTVEGYKGAKLKVTIPANSPNGKQLRCRGRGYPSFNGGENGDLYITVQVGTETPAYHATAENAEGLQAIPVTAIINLDRKKAKTNSIADVSFQWMRGTKKITETVLLPIPSGVVHGEKLFYPNVKVDGKAVVFDITATVDINLAGPLYLMVSLLAVFGLLSAITWGIILVINIFNGFAALPLQTVLVLFLGSLAVCYILSKLIDAYTKAKYGPKTPEEKARCQTPRNMSAYM